LWVVCCGSVVLWWFCQVPSIHNRFVRFALWGCVSCARRPVRVLVLFIFVLLLFCFRVCFVLLVCDSWRSTSMRVFLRWGVMVDGVWCLEVRRRW
jgi:hypothetical protein